MKNILLTFIFGFLSIFAFAQPANDACSSAQTVTPNGACVNGTTVAAVDNWINVVGCQTGNNNSNHPDVWYSFTATGSEASFTVTAGTFGGNIELILVSGTCSGGLSLMGSDCGPSPLNTTITGLTAGTTYLYTISNTPTGTPGTFTTCVTTTSPPPLPGQDCTSGAILCNNNTFTQGTFTGTGIAEDVNTNSCFGQPERQSKWYRFTAGCSGTFEFVIRPNNYNSALQTGDDFDFALWNTTTSCYSAGSTMAAPIACNWSGCAGVTGISPTFFGTTAGTDYQANNPAGPGDCLSNQQWVTTPVNLVAGQTYSLLIDNYSSTGGGFAVNFGGTAVIGPSAAFTYTSSGCGTYTFTKTCATTNSTFLWSFGDGTTSTAQNPPAHTYPATGVYTVSLEVTDALGCVRTSSITLNVNYPVATATPASQTICSSQLTSIALSSTIPGTTYTWTVVQAGVSGASAGSGSTIAQSLSTTGATAGTATYTITPTAAGCVGTPITVVITVIPAPTFALIPPICAGDPAPVLPTTSLNGITGTWSPAVNNTVTTIYTFTPDAVQCSSTTTLTITVNQPTTPTFAAIAPICTGAPAPVLPTTSLNGITGSWSPAVNNTNTTTYTFTPNPGQCATTTTLTITVTNGITPTFNAIAPICSGDPAPVLPTTSTNGITGSWSPAVNNTATTTYTFTPAAGQCATTTTLTLTVNTQVTPTFAAIAPICSGAPAPVLPTTSTNGITGTWSPAVNNTATTTYTFTPAAGQCAATTTLTITVNTQVTPTFAAIAPICSGAPAPVLPTTSTNGITGTWSPAVNNTATTTYTFTPAAGQCAATTTLTITVNTQVTPTFAAIAPICSGAPAPVLPTTSTNGITGTWSPAVNNTATTTYTFTPAAGQCATTATLTITVNTQVTPTFNAIAPICSGAPAPVLPTTSTNGITGTWSPAVNNTATTTYTFTPAAGQCATTATLTITVNTQVTPTFAAIAPICSGDPAPVLPTTSTNGITGTWSPAVNNTATTTYTFTPAAGQCATTTTLTITVNTQVTPTFAAIAPICSGDPAPVLPTPSTNGITGTWIPAVNNTATTTYTFTPSAGQCATTTTLTITVNTQVTPTFNAIAPICSGAPAPVLPTTSTNGITGTWSPAVNNTATTSYTFVPGAGQCANTTTLTIIVNPRVTPTFNSIAAICPGAPAPVLPGTSLNGITGIWTPAVVDNNNSGTYTFTPNAGECATTTTINVTVSTSITPTFDPVAPICQGTSSPVLPTTSLNGISGTWNPAIVSNTTTGTYTFTPDAGQCAVTTTLSVAVTSSITPTFNPIAPICAGNSAPVLPTTSRNGITGTWSPAVVSNTNSATYTFTPDAGQCGTTATLNVIVNASVTPTFNPVAPICSGSTAPVLPITSLNGISGFWAPAVNNTATTTYTFTPSPGQCATTATLTIIVNNQVTPTFASITPICSGSPAPVLPTTSTNGITGTWSPTTVENTTTGTYTFTPDAGQCGSTATLTVIVSSSITPTFNSIAPICSGSAAPVLPTTSTNGISGTWSPATVDNTTTGTYTFTPDAGQCGTTATLTVIVSSSITPTFNSIAPICSGSAAPVLPTTSTNGISGTWSPATVDNTTTGTYTFTPDAGQCGTTATLTVIVSSSITPTFNAIAPICSGSIAPVLPTTSTNGITGTWNPAVVNNTSGGNYTFTPDAGQCGSSVTITIIVRTNLGATFNIVDRICEGSPAPVLPSTSTNGFTGTWNPAFVDNTTTGTYTFTHDAGQCALVTSWTITVLQNIIPTFNPIAPICSGSTPPVLPVTSTNGVTGTWSPATVDNTTTGTYTFTPNAGGSFTPPTQCAISISITIVVNQPATPLFNTINPICPGATPPVLSTTSTNGITGTWTPAIVDNTNTGTYTFTPDAGQCATTTTLTVVVNSSITPTFNTIAPICPGNAPPTLPGTSTNGITGIWSPAIVDNTTTGTYTFTPNPGQCGTITTITIIVSTSITPTFNAIVPICSGSPAPVLPTLSNNGITGTWSPATIDNTTTGIYTFTPDAGQCGTTTTLTVTVNSGITPTFNTIAPICPGSVAPVLPSVSTNGITGTWSPATVDNTTTGTYTFIPDAGQCATTATLTVSVSSSITPTFTAIAPICTGSTAPLLPTTSLNGITGTWNPATVDNTTTGTYTFTPDAGQCGTTATLTVTVSSTITPAFNTISPICSGSTAPVLQTTSLNGITGTWNPAIVDNTNTGTYTFTPDAGQCGTTATITVIVTSSINSVFSAIAPICSGGTAPILPSTSDNGVTGSWNPAIVDNSTTGIYTFTPDAGQCATTTTLTVTVNSGITPIFNTIAAICPGSTPPVLPTTSVNGITGIWSPATVDNTTTGTYTFTPDAGQCGTTATITVTVSSSITPAFNAIAPICPGSVAPVLPTTSTNGITGTWSPATVDNTTTGTYTFTPDAGQCGTTATITVTVSSSITPTFNAIAPICSGGTAPVLPTTSTNGITGTWSPATVDNTTTGTYTFTPDAGQCGTTATLTVTVSSSITPTFNAIAPICSGGTAPVLPTTSTNGITGTWSPATVDNTTTGTYTFTPDAGQCGTTATITVTVSSSITPAFNAIAPICSGGTAPVLPTTSTNGITGTWSPATVDNTTTGTYTFTPDAGQCGTTATLTVTVSSSITPTFNAIAPICSGSAAPVLPTTSTNGITGSWSPATVDNTTIGTYTFTPDAGQCGTTATLTVTVSSSITPTFNAIAPICSGSAAPVLPTTSTNGITGTWNPSTADNTTTGTYTFTPDAGQCGTTATLTITVSSSITPTFNAIAPICSGSAAPVLPTTSTNGITGTWNPSIVSNTASGTYTFTPSAGQCANTTTLSVNVNPQVTPTFAPIAPFCEGSSSPVLPATSTNGITGTWNPAIVSNTASGTYTFTPAAGQCASNAVLPVTVNNQVTPTFSAIAPVCAGSTAPVLPTVSTNGINGSWNPATVSNTASGTYTFTPTAGQCATTATLNVEVRTESIPVFAAVLPICYGAAPPVLPAVSLNGISGTWTPSTISNTVSKTYIFIPDPAQCGAISTSLQVTVNPPVIADAGEDDYAEPNIPYQLNGSGGISYNWSPASLFNNAGIRNPTVTLTSNTQLYLTVTDGNGCSGTDTVTIKLLNGPGFYIPNAFTPNGDGLNDVFKPTPAGIKTLKYFRVYNRYGELVFETNQINKGWNGMYKGMKQNIGAYAWSLEAVDRTGENRKMSGYVVLIR